MKQKIVFGIAAAALLCAAALMYAHTAALRTSRMLVLDGQSISLDIADTESARERGLGGRSGLAQNAGMLFIFDSDGEWGFWMKDMSFAIDIVWFSSDKRVVFVSRNVSPATYPAVFTPTSPARYVLELPAGWVEAHHVAIGDVAQF